MKAIYQGKEYKVERFLEVKTDTWEDGDGGVYEYCYLWSYGIRIGNKLEYFYKDDFDDLITENQYDEHYL